MASKIYLNNIYFRLCGAFLLAAALLALSACTIKRPVMMPDRDTALPRPEMVDSPGTRDPAVEARVAASHSLTREGYRMLQNNNYDGAIRVLERAVGVNPNDGPGYFYLAEAWLEKGNFDLAARFNGLAILYLRDDPEWTRQARAQKQRIADAAANFINPE